MKNAKLFTFREKHGKQTVNNENVKSNAKVNKK